MSLQWVALDRDRDLPGRWRLDILSILDYDEPVGEGLNVSASTARKLLRDILASGLLHFSGHAKREMARDRLTTVDAVNVLRAGVVEPSELENGSWRHRVTTNSICVVVTLASETEAIVVTAWRMRR